MSADLTQNRSINSRTGLANSASALVALVAVAAIMTSLPGAHARAMVLDGRALPTEAPTVRAVAAAVAAAARELVGAERITAAHAAGEFATLNAPPVLSPISAAIDRAPQSLPLCERLIDLPPPTC